jgi:hypothetical protein
MRLQRSPKASPREKRFCAASDIDHAAVGILASIIQSLEIRGLISREHSSRYALSRAVLRAKLPDDRRRPRARQVNAPRSSRPSKGDLESPHRRATDDRRNNVQRLHACVGPFKEGYECRPTDNGKGSLCTRACVGGGLNLHRPFRFIWCHHQSVRIWRERLARRGRHSNCRGRASGYARATPVAASRNRP